MDAVVGAAATRRTRRRTCCPTAATACCSTEVGGGGSRWGDLALTRWTPDPTLDEDGFRIYVQDADDGRTWTAFRDAGAEPGSQRALFHPHQVEYASAATAD